MSPLVDGHNDSLWTARRKRGDRVVGKDSGDTRGELHTGQIGFVHR